MEFLSKTDQPLSAPIIGTGVCGVSHCLGLCGCVYVDFLQASFLYGSTQKPCLEGLRQDELTPFLANTLSPS